jgi:hypothetical protein
LCSKYLVCDVFFFKTNETVEHTVSICIYELGIMNMTFDNLLLAKRFVGVFDIFLSVFPVGDIVLEL